MEEITDRQRRVLDCLTAYVGREGMAPTIREIGECAGFASTSAVNYQLKKLEAAGLITTAGGSRRARGTLPAGGVFVGAGDTVTVRAEDGSLVTGELVAA